MFYDIGYPNVSLSDWEAFRKQFSPFIIDQVIDRKETGLPDWFVPLARGVAVASDSLLRKAGHRPGLRRPRGWREKRPESFSWETDLNSRLQVRHVVESDLWTVEQFVYPLDDYQVDEVLVYVFGWTPIFTRSYQSAMRLAMHCHEKGLRPGLRWFKANFKNDELAVEIARQRRIDEAIWQAKPVCQLH